MHLIIYTSQSGVACILLLACFYSSLSKVFTFLTPHVADHAALLKGAVDL